MLMNSTQNFTFFLLWGVNSKQKLRTNSSHLPPFAETETIIINFFIFTNKMFQKYNFQTNVLSKILRHYIKKSPSILPHDNLPYITWIWQAIITNGGLYSGNWGDGRDTTVTSRLHTLFFFLYSKKQWASRRRIICLTSAATSIVSALTGATKNMNSKI